MIKDKEKLYVICIVIAVLVVITSGYAILSDDMGEIDTFTSLHGEEVQLYQKGLYKNESYSLGLQLFAQDIVTIFIAIPLLLLSLYFSTKGSIKAYLILAGTMGYFVYTYLSYLFLCQFNPFFLVYCILSFLSVYGLIILLSNEKAKDISSYFRKKTPIRFLGMFQIICASLFLFMWLNRIIPTFNEDFSKIQLEHYTSLVIQGLDMGFVIPFTIMSGIMIMKKHYMGFMLSSVLIFKLGTLMTVICAMIAVQHFGGVEQNIIETSIMISLTLLVYAILTILLVSIQNKKQI